MGSRGILRMATGHRSRRAADVAHILGYGTGACAAERQPRRRI